MATVAGAQVTPRVVRSVRAPKTSASNQSKTFNLADFGATGDGQTDDGPALQAAFDALALAGGGTLIVPAGSYAIATPVATDFGGHAGTLIIAGVASETTVAPTTAQGAELAHGLDLESEFLPRTAEAGDAIRLSRLSTLVVKDIAFVGTPDIETDAATVLHIIDVDDAAVSHCEFYGLSTSVYGSTVQAEHSGLTIEQSVFLGCTANSGAYTSVVQNLDWKSFRLNGAVFVDYGLRPELFSKTGLAAPFSWINLGDAAAVTNDSPRREAVFRNLFLDEGGFVGISSISDSHSSTSTPIDLVYISGLRMNVSNLGTSGHLLTGLQGALVENAFYGWSHNADSAISLSDMGHAILDHVETEASATRIRADETTARLSVINSVYEELASLSPQTFVINTATPDEDPVQYVRNRFNYVLGHEPDAAAHFYWSDRILRCGDDARCVEERHAALDAYLVEAPSKQFSMTGLVSNDDGSPLAGITVTLSGSQMVTTVTDADGLYHFSGLPTSGVYNVAASKLHYTFSTPQSFTTPPHDVRADFTATHDRFAVSGRLTDDEGRALANVTVALGGSRSATTTTDTDGNYSFNGLAAGGDYTVTPSLTSFVFIPASLSFTDISGDCLADFTGTPTVRSIIGMVVNSNNTGLEGIKVTLSGSRSATTTTDASGNYRFDRLPVGASYMVTASQLGYVFAPASRSFDNLNADQYAGFIATFVEYKIGGRVAKSDGAGVSGVAVALSGSQSASATTDASGNYSFANVALGGDYTITLSKTDYTFNPTRRTFTALGANQTADFTATPGTHAMAGHITEGGKALAGVLVTLSGSRGATATTDANGDYSFTSLPSDGIYTLTPGKAGYIFTPPSQTFDSPTSDRTANFAASPDSYRIAGRVTENGAGLGGASVALTGSQSATATTDAVGNYSFTVRAQGSYTVNASKTHYTFAPTTMSFNNVAGDQTANFAATFDRYTISGRVADANNTGLAGVTITLSGSQSLTTKTDASGNYSFAGLGAGGSYTLTPSFPQLTFSPASQTFADLGADSFAGFIGGLATYTIRGRVTEKGAGLAGVTVDFAGTHLALGQVGGRVVTGADGAYTFAALAGGDYTITPSKKNYAFDRPASSFKSLSADQTADFAATLQTVIGFDAASYNVSEGGASLIVTVTRGGDTSTNVTAIYEALGDTAKRGSDFDASIGLLTFAPGEVSKSFAVFITDDSFVEGPERFTLTLAPGAGAIAGDVVSATVTISDNDTAPASANPVDDDEFFVRQHYRDFFSREPDASGLQFWTGEIKRCGSDAACRESRRTSVSAAFFLSIEFKETGYLVYRLYRATYGRMPKRVSEFMLDERVIGEGVVVGAPGWDERLAANKKAFMNAWTQRPDFKARYGGTDDSTFINMLFENMGVQPTQAERDALLADLRSGLSRAEVLAKVADNEQFNKQEFNRAFVLMQYFGYLRRDPDEAPDTNLDGLNYWLKKLVEFGGDYQKAEMVKAFLSSTEYRGRFGN
jgi:protocatechuate 3,4-dioxygenase beta subunit